MKLKFVVCSQTASPVGGGGGEASKFILKVFTVFSSVYI